MCVLIWLAKLLETRNYKWNHKLLVSDWIELLVNELKELLFSGSVVNWPLIKGISDIDMMKRIYLIELD